ncbi:SANT/Myb_domain [Hexamita inflata]|uniref:SANT/Myb domain n=1 Tax=Hexamita inflata TaxID=28002 RepID=A0AA86PS09_9EUKA|nr:SANT/Myb domain [Hexamita inflata]
MYQNHRWTEAENKEFSKLLKRYQKDFTLIAEKMDKSYSQVRSHYYNIQKKERDLKTSLNLAEFKKNYDIDQSIQRQSDQPIYQFIVFERVQ